MTDEFRDDDLDLVNSDKFVDLVIDWPSATVSFDIRRAPVSDAEIDEFQAMFVSVMKLAQGDSDKVPKKKMFILMKLDGIAKATMAQKMRASSFVGTVQQYIDCIQATALVVTSDLVRAVLKVIMMIRPFQSNYEIFSDEAAAAHWLRQLQQKAAQ